ncbi:hypothetical protein ACSRDI_19390, partial [Acinetobacter baumannii]|uniref:hypothetical protein n=1 Tax=Acinetobacter baumannii TaxID=470 RepID=UPI003EDACCCE
QGNVDVADADVTVTVDTVPADLIGAITIPEDLNGDGTSTASGPNATCALKLPSVPNSSAFKIPSPFRSSGIVTQGNVDVADADVTVTVDTVPADLIGAITIPEDL